MKIQSVTTTVAEVPLERAFSGPRDVKYVSLGYIVTQVRTDSGLQGVGMAWSANSRQLKALRMFADELGAFLTGDDPLMVERAWEKMRTHSGLGPAGVAAHAMAMLDTALWDIAAKAAGMPLWKMLGGYRDKVYVYSSDGLWRSMTPDELARSASDYVKRGFRAMKMRLGGDRTVAQELERVRAVRQAIGDGIELMVDINEAWTPQRAVQVGHLLEEFNLYWLEDPVTRDDVAGMAHVSASLRMPVAAGEYRYGTAPLREFVERKAVDILMVDIHRVGGLTPWRKMAGYCEVMNVPLATHVMPEVLGHMGAAYPGVIIVEHMPWSFPLLREQPQVVDGYMLMSQKPGLGWELDEKALAKYKAR